jgi:hydroxymethylpyrimidine pyrophosphatase-like HAD family hydrolase
MKIPLNKLVLLDLDATLIDKNYNFTWPLQQLRRVVESMENAGWKIGLNSDTPLQVLVNWENEIGLNGPVVAEKGQLLMIDGKTIVKDRDIPIEFEKMFKTAQTLLEAEGITVWSGGDPVARIRNGELIGGRGETVVMLNPLRKCSLGLFVRINDGTHFRFPEFDEYNKILEVIKPVLNWQTIGTHNDLNAGDGVIIIAPKGGSKRDGTKLLMQELGLKQIGMIGNSMSDYLGEDIALHYAVGNAGNEFKDKAIYVAENNITGGVIEILTKFLRTEAIVGKHPK